MVDRHRLSEEALTQIFSCSADHDTLDSLKAAQHSRRLLLLRAVVGGFAARPGVLGRLGSTEDAWQVLTAAERIDRHAVADLLTHPSTGVWLVRALQLLRGRPADGAPPWAELGHLHTLAAAAAVRTGMPGRIRVPLVEGTVALPTVGVFVASRDSPDRLAELRCADGEAEVHLLGRPEKAGEAVFHPVCRHRAEAERQVFEVELDVGTPYREFSDPLPSRTLAADELAEWRAHLDGAWRVLTRFHPHSAAELAALFRTVVPTSRRLVGASSPLAFGAVMASMPKSSSAFADTLVHELRHSQLNAVAELVGHPRHEGRFRVPWRDEPRPAFAVLHGLHAFTGSAEFWAVQRRHCAGRELREATFLFAYRRAQVRAALSTTPGIRHLDAPWHLLVECVGNRLDACSEPVPDEVAAEVDAMLT